MTDNEIIKALRFCSDQDTCSDDCSFYVEGETVHECTTKLSVAALALIKRQQAKIDELTVKEARFAFDRIHYNIAELNLIKAGFDIAEIKRRFRAEFEENMELGVDDCINWADWLDSIVSELLE